MIKGQVGKSEGILPLVNANRASLKGAFGDSSHRGRNEKRLRARD